MSIELILVGIGILLGIANLVYWVWLAKREKVAIVNPDVYAEFLPKGYRERFPLGVITLARAVISIDASCELVLKAGEKELEVKGVEVILDKKTCESLGRYFEAPRHSRLYLWQVDDYDKRIFPPPRSLALKKAVRFQNKIPIDCTDEFEEEYEEIESGSYPEFIQPLLDELETKYQICWTRYDGKELHWRFPQKWWRNLGKRLWG